MPDEICNEQQYGVPGVTRLIIPVTEGIVMVQPRSDDVLRTARMLANRPQVHL